LVVAPEEVGHQEPEVMEAQVVAQHLEEVLLDQELRDKETPEEVVAVHQHLVPAMKVLPVAVVLVHRAEMAKLLMVAQEELE
jgi:hypothetical protein